jgi:hypothetical protein
MFKNSRQSYGLCFVFCLAAQACSSSAPQSSKVNQGTGSWGYNQIRQARDAEKMQEPSAADLAARAEEDANCVVMSLAEKNRSHAMGCRKLDARDGHGENAWCCPPQNH